MAPIWMPFISTPKLSDHVTIHMVVYWLYGHIGLSAIIAFFASFMSANVWSTLHSIIPSDRWFFILGTMALHAVLYFGCNGFYLMCHYKGWLQKYQLPRTKGQPFPSNELLKSTLTQGIIGQFGTGWITLYLAWELFKYMGTSAAPEQLPGFTELFTQFIASSFWLDASFFATHSMLHRPYWYKKVHKQHHQYRWTIGFAAEYAHPFEAAFSAEIPTALVMILFGCHVWTWWVWLAWRLWETYESHSGFAFPMLHGDFTEYHDFHHTHNVGNYAGSPLLDTIFGTNKAWLAYHRKRLAALDEAKKAE